MDRKNGKLVINSVHAEPDPSREKFVGEEIGE